MVVTNDGFKRVFCWKRKARVFETANFNNNTGMSFFKSKFKPLYPVKDTEEMEERRATMNE